MALGVAVCDVCGTTGSYVIERGVPRMCHGCGAVSEEQQKYENTTYKNQEEETKTE